MLRPQNVGWFANVLVFFAFAIPARAQLLQEQLAAERPAALASAAAELGDARRGAILFYQPYMACTKCHTDAEGDGQLGPDLAKPSKEVTVAHLIESVLNPSAKIKKGYETITVVTQDGLTINGLLVRQHDDTLVLRDPSQDGKLLEIPQRDIAARRDDGPSTMPAGLANQLASRQQFLDLVSYLIEINDGGPARVLELKPDPALYAPQPLPEYETRLDHAGLVSSWNRQSFQRGKAIYERLCINCHGTHDKPGSLPTSLRFASGEFKSGSDPYTMYQTLTKGFGMMVPQMWMVPQQKYDVIHYIREAYLKDHNPDFYASVDADYLARLPKGDTRGPAPSKFEPWVAMNYGPNLVATYEIGNDGSNFAYKGNAIRLDGGPGGVSRGHYWMVFDYDTLRVAAGWSGDNFIDWNGINFNGRHQVHPRVAGKLHFANPTGPGWAEPSSETFSDPRIVGRDGRLYGPLPRSWAHYKGMYYHRNEIIVSYTVGDTDVLELPGLELVGDKPIFKRTFNIGRRRLPMVLQVARLPGTQLRELRLDGAPLPIAALGGEPAKRPATAALEYRGQTHVELAGDEFDMTNSDYTVFARIKTRKGGTVFCKTAPSSEWVHDGKSLFVRGGRLVFDIGWVGAVQSRQRVNDGKWHEVAMTFRHESGLVTLYVDGKVAGQGELKPKNEVIDHVVRLGYTAPNFPTRQSYFDGELSEVLFLKRALDTEDVAKLPDRAQRNQMVGHWKSAAASNGILPDSSGRKHNGTIHVGASAGSSPAQSLFAGVAGDLAGGQWRTSDQGDLRLVIPPGDQPLRFTLWMTQPSDADAADDLSALAEIEGGADLRPLLSGGPPRWPERLVTEAKIGADDGPFGVDILTHPETNPWHCRIRLTGFDFLPDGDRLAVCAWDGSVWMVSGLSQLPPAHADGAGPPAKLTWHRIASGLFQPLGLKYVDGKIYVSCRDQIAILHDLNDDGEIDFFENFNNDHQVTDHFHEFAMGLQTDEAGNFYYAKSARHALTALVPHHGTLLKVSRDGTRTEILANGFRAANGVCVNPDGSFIVTDQEGHWNPKNRINWVTKGGFYGNMFGYHDVDDESDEAMVQPLCWITNAFDRSPAELLWVDSERWGPLNRTLLNLSYGYGKVYVVPHEKVDGQVQGGMCQLPIDRFPTGVMRGRFHPGDGQLYTCGMFAWAGNQQQPGGLYRIRYTGKPVHLPIGLHARPDGMTLTFSGPLDPQSTADMARFAVKTWSLKRTARYGSDHYDQKRLQVTEATLSADRQSLHLTIPDIQPTWCMEIKYQVRGAGGEPVEGVIHNTIHRLGPAETQPRE